MAIKDFYPAIRPTLDLNFTGSRSVDPIITFSRSGTGNVASCFDEKGVMRFAPQNVPRIDFNPVTGECLGLLMEEQRTNLLTYSNDFSNAVWSYNKTTVAANTTLSPSGEMNASSFANDTTTGQHNFATRNNQTITANTNYTYSIHLKYGTVQYVILQLNNGANTDGAKVCVDLINGNLSNVTNNGLSTGATAEIKNAGNGWWLVSLTVLVDATSTTVDINNFITTSFSTNIASYTGSSSEVVYGYGAQLEAGLQVSTYIPTTSAQVTRAADAMSITGSNFSSFFNANEGAVVIESEYFGPNTQDPTTSGIVSLSDGATNYFSIVARTDANTVRGVITPGSSFITVNNNYPKNTSKKIALAYKNNDFGFCIGGEDVSTNNTNQSNANINSLIIGAYYVTTNRKLNGRIKRIAIYNRRIADAQLQALTA